MSLIVGASLLTWLTMVGTVAAVIYVAVADEDTSVIDDGGQSYKDEDGYKCDYLDTDINDLCPANPKFAD